MVDYPKADGMATACDRRQLGASSTMPQLYDAFISYGRADSKAFAAKLYQLLTKQGYRVWLDLNDIPLGVDYDYVLAGLTADWWSLLKSEWFESGQFGVGAGNWSSNVGRPRRGHH